MKLELNPFLKRLIVVLFCAFYSCLSSQELPPILNFPPSIYGAENQNWSTSQGKGGRIYVANNKGLLVYNGAEWQFYDSPNESIIRSVEVAQERIYTGAYMEFGHWERDETGALVYTSLTEKLKISHTEDEEFWNIISLPDGIIFQSLDRIYIYNPGEETIDIIDAEGRITKAFHTQSAVYFQVLGKGLYKIEKGKELLESAHEILKENEIISIFGETDGLLLLSRNRGFFRLQGGDLEPWKIEANDLLAGTYSGIRLADNSYAIGSIADGLLLLSSEGELISEINQNRGLQNNTILSLMEDVGGNLWLGLDNGLTCININAPFRIFRNSNLGIGSVYAAAKHGGNLYLGTNQGLFYRSLDSEEDFKMIKGTQGQVWSLREIDSRLYCGHDKGAFFVNDTEAQVIFSDQGVWDIKQLTKSPGALIMGTYDGLYVVEGSSRESKLRHKINGFDISSRYFEVQGTDVFVNHEYKGIFHLEVDDTYTMVRSVRVDTINKGLNSGILKFKDEILYSSRDGIFKLNRKNQQFIKDSLFSTAYAEDDYTSGRLLEDEAGLWIFTSSGLLKVSPGSLSDAPSITKYPLSREVRSNVIEYENIIKYDKDNYLIGTESGYLLLDLRGVQVEEFEVNVDHIINTKHNRKTVTQKRINLVEKGEFQSTENNLEISYYSPTYHKYLEMEYQYKLRGFQDYWSEYSSSAVAIYENLPHGSYSFQVRAKLGDKTSQNIATYDFTIKRPWFLSIPLLILYAIAALLLLAFLHLLHNRYNQRQKQKLIEENRRKLEWTKVQSEKEVIRIKNEQLQNEIKGKSKELANTTMSVVKKNELLNEIKKELASIKDKNGLKPVLKLIEKNLVPSDNWDLFKEAFENVDRDFLEKLNKRHPKLTPNDIKLCTYLRLNLSSKEIAPLFNISARSVEIKRYRLRKKLNLQQGENLVSYILEV